MTVLVNMEPESSKLEAALSRISLRFRGIETEVNKVNRSVSKINDVKIDTKASVAELQKLNQQITATSNTLTNTSKSLINTFKTLAVTLTATFAGLGIIKAADNMTQLENKIALSVGRGKELNEVMLELVDISNRTFSNLENSVSSFSKLNTAGKVFGATTEQTLKATENLQKALIISGSSAEAASGAVMQLGQGLASGVLRGDEFNSVMEGAPRIMKAIADEMGVATGQLRSLAEAGKITSDVIFSAMLNQGEAINREFSNVNPTINQLGSILSSTFSRTVATIDRSIGLTRTFGNAIKFVTSIISNNVGTIDTLAYAYSVKLKLAVQDVILVLGGVFNVFAAIGKRAAAAIPVFITPMLTLFDVIDLAGSKAIGNLFVNVIDGLMGIRIAVMDLFDNQIAVAIRNLFQARDALSIRKALDDLAVAFETVGLRWYNVINRITIVGRGLSIWFLETGIFLGLIDQKLLRLRYASIERLGKAFEYVSIVMLEVLLNILTFTGIVDIFVAIEAAVKYAGRVIESFAPNLAEKLADERSKVSKTLYYLGVDLNAFGLKAGLAIGYIFIKAASALQKLYLRPFVETKESLDIFIDSMMAFKNLVGSSLVNAMNKLAIVFDSLFAKIKEVLLPAKESIDEFANDSTESIEEFASAISDSNLFKSISNKIKEFVNTLKLYLEDNQYFNSFVEQVSKVKTALIKITDDLTVLGQTMKQKLYDSFGNLDNLFESLYPTAKATLDKTLRVVMDFVKKVEYGFFWLYDRVVGNSWWPDLISKIAIETYRLHSEVLPEIELFIGIIDRLFAKLGRAVGLDVNLNLPSLTNILDWFKDLSASFASSLVDLIGGSFKELKEFSPELGNQIGLAIIGAMLTALAAAGINTWVGLVTFTTFISAFDAAFKLAGNSIISSGIIQQVFESAGREVGKLLGKIIDNIPIIVEILLQGASEFTSALLSQLGAVGNLLKSIISIVPGGGILELLIFGSSIGIIFGKLDAVKSAINIFLSFVTGSSIGGAGMNARGTRPEGILGYILFGQGRLLFGLATAAIGVISVLDNLLNGIIPLGTIAGSLGLVGLAVLGGKGSVDVVLSAIDKVSEGILGLFGKTPTFSIWDMIFSQKGMNLGGFQGPTQTKSLKDKIKGIIDSITDQGSISSRISEAITNFSWSGFAANLQSMVTFAQAKWASMILFMSNAWTGLLLRTSLVLGLIQARVGAWIASLNSAAILSGPLGLIGRFLLGGVGIAIIIGLFTTSANAATGEMLDSIASVTSYVPMGLLGLFLLGAAANPRAALLMVVKSVSFAVTSMLNLGKLLLATLGVTGLVGKAILGTMASSWLAGALAGITKMVLGWAMTLGLQLLVIIPSAFSAAFTAAGVSIGVLAGSIGFILPALAAVVAGLFFFGDSLSGWVGDLVFKITGIGTAAQKTKKQLQDILTVDKVGQIDVVLKSKLDEININALSEKELATLKRELITANSILERNQSIFEQEGDLTRSQIEETNRALERANDTLDRLASKGEASFAGGILKTIGSNLDFEELRTGLGAGLSDNMFVDQINQTVNPIINRITEALNNPNATNEDVARALVDLNNLLNKTDTEGNALFSPEERATLFANVQNSETALRLLQDYSPVFESLAKGIPLSLDKEQLAQLASGAEGRFLQDPNAEANALTRNVNLALSGNLGNVNIELARLLETQLFDLMNQAGKSTTTEGFFGPRQMKPEEMASSLGLDNVALLKLVENNKELLDSSISTNGVYRIGLDTLLSQVKAAEQLTSEREALNAAINKSLSIEAISGPAVEQAGTDAARRKDIEAQLAQLSGGANKGGLSFGDFDYSKLTQDQAEILEAALKEYTNKVTEINRSITSDIIQRLAKEGKISQSDLAAFEESGGKINSELLDKIRSLGVQGFYTKDLQKQMIEAGDLLTTIVTTTMTASTEGLMTSINNAISKAGLDFKLDYINEEDHKLLMNQLSEIEAKQRQLDQTGSQVDFFGLRRAQQEAILLFAKTEDKMKMLAELGVDFPQIDNYLAISQSTVDSIVKYGMALVKIRQMLDAGITAGPGYFNAPVGGSPEAQARATISVIQGEIEALFKPGSTGGVGGAVSKSGGGSAKTWWEAFKEGLSSMNLSLEDDFLAAINQGTVAALTAASEKYRQAQEALNKSAMNEVEIRKAALEQMRLARLEAIDALNDGTFAGFTSQMEALNSGLEASFIGSLNKAQSAYVEAIAEKIELLRLESMSMEQGSVELQATTAAMDHLKMKLEELQKSSTVMSDAFRDGLTSFLKGEQTFKSFLEGLLDTFTSTIIEKFSTGFTDALFNGLGLDSLFSNMFQSVLEFGTTSGNKVAGALDVGLGTIAGGTPVYVVNPGFGTGVANPMGDTPTDSAMGGIGSWFSKMFSGISGFFSKIFSSITSIFSGLFGGGGFLGGIFGFADGGFISGPGTGTSDSILARISNGEYVVNAATTKRWLPFLETLNANDGRLPAFAKGGLVGPSNPSAFKTMNENNNKDKQQQVFNINVTGDVSVQTRREIARMIPEITAGVNMTNRERGSR